MKKPDKTAHKVSDRVAGYRARKDREGVKRVETTVPAEDISLMKDVATALRAGGPVATELRQGIRAILPGGQAQTGEQLLAFFRTSPLKEEDEHIFDDLRDTSPGRTVDFE